MGEPQCRLDCAHALSDLADALRAGAGRVEVNADQHLIVA